MVRQTKQIKAKPVPKSILASTAESHCWIVKFAPFRTSWSDIIRNGIFTLRGVRSPQARKNLSLMHIGDRVLFYHSQQEQAVAGLMTVAREAYPDPTSSDPHWLTCDFTPVRTLFRPVRLSKLRGNSRLTQVCLIRQPRLAVGKITVEELGEILSLSELE